MISFHRKLKFNFNLKAMLWRLQTVIYSLFGILSKDLTS